MDETEGLASLVASIGRVRLRQGATAAEILELALAALDKYDTSDAELLALIRSADNLYSKDAKYYRMTVDAKIPFTDPQYQEAKGYIVNYDVVSDSVAEDTSSLSEWRTRSFAATCLSKSTKHSKTGPTTRRASTSEPYVTTTERKISADVLSTKCACEDSAISNVNRRSCYPFRGGRHRGAAQQGLAAVEALGVPLGTCTEWGLQACC